MKKLYIAFATTLIVSVLFTNAITCGLWQHTCVLHHAAFYEADTWGFSHYKWMDTSFAQTPFQDEGWKKLQDALFQQKLNKLGIQ